MNTIIKFDGTEIEEYKFHQNKNPIPINEIDIKKIVVLDKLLFGKQDFKYFIGYKDHEKIRFSCIFCPQIIIYQRNFNENRHICFLITKKKAFMKYMEKLGISSKTSLIMNLYILKIMLSMFICANMLLDSVYRKDENFYPKVFLEIYYFIEDIEIYYVILMKNIIMKIV